MKVSVGKDFPKLINVFIEIPMGSNVKYEYDEEEEVVKVDRVLYTSMVYPFNYGFVPGTKADDGDPIDVLVISNMPFYPGTVVEARPVGMIRMTDEEGVDTKIIAVPKDKIDPTFSNIREITDIPDALKNKMVHFFEHYKELEPESGLRYQGGEHRAKQWKTLKKL